MAHPVQTVLESLYAAERCPRLHVNAMKDGVVCPDFIRDQWKDRLVIDLDASYPLSLEMDDDGLSADLSFGGYVSRCSFPWSAIYVVSDRDSGRGIVLEQNVPASVRAQMEATKRPKPRLAAVEDNEDDSDEVESVDNDLAAPDENDENGENGENDDSVEPSEGEGPDDHVVARETAKDEASAVASTEAIPTSSEPDENADAPAEEPTPPHTSEEQERTAQRRRAAFRVIDGGS